MSTQQDYRSGMTTRTNEVAAAWFDAIARLCDAAPKGWRAVHGDALALVSGAATASLNLAVNTGPDPGAASRQALDEAAAAVAGAGVPWSVSVRGAASDAVARLAARHGRTRRAGMTLMDCPAADAGLRADAASGALIRPVSAADAAAYTGALAAGFEAPAEVFAAVMGAGALDAPGFTGYLAEVDGQPVATGCGVRGDGVIGVFNITVVPSARRRGLGRAMTARVMADGFAAGAHTAYLNPSRAGRPLYESMGFRPLETWTTFTAG
jgi:GNAT superfamily N-acetyltransferase